MHGPVVQSLVRTLRWQDVVDVLVLTMLSCSAYRWLRRTVAVQAALGLLALAAGSWVANRVGLILTAYLLSAVSAVAAMVLVVVFQHELRQALTRVSPLRWLARHHDKEGPLDARMSIAQAAFAIARHGKGALIVIPRGETLTPHVSDGVLIDARLSSSVIEAIFTSASPLHDGAVMVDQERVLRAGVVLPLATDVDDNSHGTRHRAARGLAEASDALVVCVSEEHGTVSLVHGDMLETMANEAELGAALHRLWPRARHGSAQRAPDRAGVRGVLVQLTIFVCVVGAWAVLALDRSHVVVREVPLEIRGIADDLTFDPLRHTTIALEVRGSRRELDHLSPAALKAYIDLSGARPGLRSFRVQSSLPAGIEVANATPTTIELRIRARGGPGNVESRDPGRPESLRRDGERRL